MAQQENSSLLTISELMSRAASLNSRREFISGSALLFNPYDEEIKFSENFANDYFLKPENFNKCSIQIRPKEYSSIDGPVLAVNEFNSYLGVMSSSVALENKLLNCFSDAATLKKFLGLFGHESDNINVNLALSNPGFGIFSAIPIGIYSDGFCKGMSEKPCEGKYYILKS
ncbi:MAG: hypothetical protein ACLFN8_04755 [Candidatus Woesearchaeota archaeon]